MSDLYETLGLPKNASKADIKRARKRKAQKLHPDRNKDPKAAQEMVAVNAAADVLEDDERRRRYDQGEGTNRAPTREQEARKTVVLFMNEALQMPRCNIPAYVIAKLEGRRPDIVREMESLRQRVAMLKERRTEVTTDDPDNIFDGLMDGFIRECEHKIAMGEEALATLKIAIEIACRYKSKVSDPATRAAAPPGAIWQALRQMRDDMQRAHRGLPPDVFKWDIGP